MVTIMIIDDMKIIHEIFNEVLKLKGHTILFNALSAVEVEEYFSNPKNQHPEIIILDHRMPNKDGLTVLKEILNIDNKIKVIFVSADEAAKNEALKLGANDYLVKPVSIKTILETIQRIAITG